MGGAGFSAEQAGFTLEQCHIDKVCGKPLAKHEQKGYVKREPRLLPAGRNRGRHGAVNAPVHGYQHSDNVLRPRPIASGPRSTLIQRKTPTRGQGPKRRVGQKQPYAWRPLLISVCAVPTHRPEGSRAEPLITAFLSSCNGHSGPSCSLLFPHQAVLPTSLLTPRSPLTTSGTLPRPMAWPMSGRARTQEKNDTQE